MIGLTTLYCHSAIAENIWSLASSVGLPWISFIHVIIKLCWKPFICLSSLRNYKNDFYCTFTIEYSWHRQYLFGDLYWDLYVIWKVSVMFNYRGFPVQINLFVGRHFLRITHLDDIPPPDFPIPEWFCSKNSGSRPSCVFTVIY